jgi:hypothetical protein
MLPSLSRGMRAALVLALCAGYIGWHTHKVFAHAKTNNGDDDGASSAGGGGDDDDDDDGGKGGKGDNGGGDDDDDDGPDKDQPPATAGGLFTIKTYPQNELLRPLTITEGVTQLKLGIGTDISAKGAFDSAGVSLEAEYGLKDNFMLIGGITDAYNFKQFSIYAGFEASLIYDLLDFRAALDVHRNAVPALNGQPGYGQFCDPPTMPGEMAVNMGSAGLTCSNAQQSIDLLPTGDYIAGGTKFSIDIGFPIRYAFVPQFAVVALQTLMSIDFNSVAIDHINVIDTGMQANNAAMTEIYQAVPTGNSAKPDLNPSIGLAANPIPQLSIVAFAQLRIPDFDTAAGSFQIPVTLRIEASANHQLDFGLEFTLLNVDPPDPQSPIDNRYISAYAQARF